MRSGPHFCARDDCAPMMWQDNHWYAEQHAVAPGPATAIACNASAALAAACATAPGVLDAKLAQLAAPSAAIIAVQDGATLFESYRGTARVGKNVPVTRESAYMIASNTKVFTSTMLFQLRDRGLLPQGLDTEVGAIMPGWREPRSPYASARGLTLRALATHSSGLVREVPGNATDEAGILAAIGATTVLFPQFAATHYSNLGVSLLGRALGHAANTTWERWIQDEILTPLGMANSGPFVRTAAEAATLVDGTDPGEPGPDHVVPVTPSPEAGWGAPCGSMFSTPADMAKWVSFLLGQGQASGRASGNANARVLDPASLFEMRNMLMAQPDGLTAIGAATFEAAFSHGRWTFNKLGCLGGYRSDITLVPDLGPADLAVVAVSVLIGAVTFSGSFVAWGKLRGRSLGAFPGIRLVSIAIALGVIAAAVLLTISGESGNPEMPPLLLAALAVGALLLGVVLVLPIGGADMPVVVALLNSYSGLAAAATGFVLGNVALVVSGALVGAERVDPDAHHVRRHEPLPH